MILMSPPTTSITSTTRTTTIGFRGTDSLCLFGFTSPKCAFKSKMRIPKKPVSFCLSILSTAKLSSPSFASPIRFHSRILDCRFSSGTGDQAFRSRKTSVDAAGALGAGLGEHQLGQNIVLFLFFPSILKDI
ncbi:hypothetical protein NE237_017577 [Protea cynaroides]|uniref:Uncharacterized protein n=1 Tax=Protea cynaroides TaxID=273540 RepID=A0A9Q0QN65_9MAGN|nr:hypothetical protein NE237_017577 [Protea cynaroides]